MLEYQPICDEKLTTEWYLLVIQTRHQEAPFMYLCSEVNMFGWFHPWTSLPLSVLTDTFFHSNLCPPTAFSHNMPILLYIPPLLWKPLPLALHWNLNSPSLSSPSCYPSIGAPQTSRAMHSKLLSHFCLPPWCLPLQILLSVISFWQRNHFPYS